MRYSFKKSQCVRLTQFFITGEETIRGLLGDEMLEHLILYFHSCILSSFMLVILGNALLENSFLFTTLMVSPCLWTMDMSNVFLLTAVIWPWKETKNVFGANAVWISPAKDAGAAYAAFIWHRLRQPWPFCWALCFPDILLQILIIWLCFDTKPNCQTEWSGGKSAMAGCFYPQSSEIMMMSRCQSVKFYSSKRELNSWQSSGSEVYSTDEEVCLLIGIWK